MTYVKQVTLARVALFAVVRWPDSDHDPNALSDIRIFGHC